MALLVPCRLLRMNKTAQEMVSGPSRPRAACVCIRVIQSGGDGPFSVSNLDALISDKFINSRSVQLQTISDLTEFFFVYDAVCGVRDFVIFRRNR